ncbi:MAG TPA: amidohydrolase, partial [Desulfobacterales bacterium]|nr:amidohydrolase [Desulfobacterales bacterium]
KGNGADMMVQAGAIDDLSAIFAGHIDTHFDTGVVTVDEGIICAYADPFIITLTGKSGHAARPHECKDTIVAAAGLITSMQSIVAREVDPNHAAVITVGKLRAGTILNVVAGEAVIEGTIRSTTPEARNNVISALKRKVAGNADGYGVKANLQFPPGLPAVINSDTAAKFAGMAACAIVQEKNVVSQGPSSLGGEDFAFYQQKTQGCLVRFGAKLSDETGHAHSPFFDFDEKVFPIGASWYAEVAQRFLLG